MPEINEVRAYANFIKKKLKNKYILDIRILQGRYKKHKPFELYNKLKRALPIKVLDVKTKGKFLYMSLTDDYYIFSTLGLTGGWVFYSDKKKEYESPFMDKHYDINHLNVEFKTDGGKLYFFDTLSFGTLKVINDKASLIKKLDSIGPDVMDSGTDLKLFTERIRLKKNMDLQIGTVLMNQKVISGIGNYLRADILWMSKINPFRKVMDLSDKDIKTIYEKSKIAASDMYEHHIYNKKYDINGHPVVKEVLFGGGTKRYIYWVPEIQK